MAVGVCGGGGSPRSSTRSRGKTPQEALYKYTHAWKCTRGAGWQCVHDSAHSPRRRAGRGAPNLPTDGAFAPRLALVCAGRVAETVPRGWRASHEWGAAWSECDRDISPFPLLPFLSTLGGRILRAPVGRDPKQMLGSRVSLSPCAVVAALLAPAGTDPEEAAAPAARARTAPRPSETQGCGHQHLAHFPLHLWQMPALSRQEHKEPSLFGSSAPRRLLPRPVPPAPLPSRNRSWTQPELLFPSPRSASPPYRSPFNSVVSPIQTKKQEVHSEKVFLPFAHFEA